MQDAASTQRIAQKYEALSAMMNERMRRQWAASEARAYGWGGVHAVSTTTGISPHTIRKGLVELADRETACDRIAKVVTGKRETTAYGSREGSCSS